MGCRAKGEAGREGDGVRLSRLDFARYALADLFLDTFPYGAHTTASDAMWMGTPVLTLEGRGFASRVCAGLVRSAGMPDLNGLGGVCELLCGSHRQS